MENKKYQNLLTEREATIVFNKGLQAAIFVLESVGPLSSEGIRFMIAELKEQIAKSEAKYTRYLLECLSWDIKDSTRNGSRCVGIVVGKMSNK